MSSIAIKLMIGLFGINYCFNVLQFQNVLCNIKLYVRLFRDNIYIFLASQFTVKKLVMVSCNIFHYKKTVNYMGIFLMISMKIRRKLIFLQIFILIPRKIPCNSQVSCSDSKSRCLVYFFHCLFHFHLLVIF